MSLLLDTHIWLWVAENDKKLSRTHASLIEKASTKVSVSAVSVWEIAMLMHYGRLTLNSNPRSWVENACQQLDISIVPLTPDIALESYNLPGSFHKDPADRMIVATARQHGLTLVTQDKAILTWAKKGHVMTVK